MLAQVLVLRVCVCAAPIRLLIALFLSLMIAHVLLV
jgi:hypothetical protein